ncbi:MAG: chromate resistance protein ChrB domain-containing protein [Candidatus Polarisedimenticolia bacterium]
MSIAPARTWLLLVHHLPPRPTRLRVRVWRQLQKLGAVVVKNSVYVLPSSDKSLEDFTWLQQEINSGGGGAVVFEARSVAGATDEEIVAAFRRDRTEDYERLTASLKSFEKRMSGKRRAPVPAPAELSVVEAEMSTMQGEFTRITEMDLFAAPSRAEAEGALERCHTLLRAAQGRRSGPARRSGAAHPRRDPGQYQGRLWVTRPRPHIDRCASAWLIRRFIDRRPRFAFHAPGEVPRGGIPFDMAGAELGHQGEDCTFETLMKQFGLQGDPALAAIARIVHDVDLKDGKFGRPEAPGVNAVLRGLEARIADDQKLIREAGGVFDGLYATLAGRPARAGKGGRRVRR